MAASVKIHPDQEYEALPLSAARPCGVCLEAVSKYTCPRCNLFYCSVCCFKSQKHAGCSESFYKDCFMEEMKSSRVDDKEKRRIMKMLKDFEEDQEEDGVGESSLEWRLQGVKLDDADDVWKRLTPEEREEFRKSVQSGNLVNEWKPWWLHHDTNLIKELGDDFATTQDSGTKSVAIPEHELCVPELSTLLRGKEPSPLIRNNLVEVLFCYTFFCRKYNGDVREFRSRIAHDVIHCSRFLRENTTVQTLHEALQVAMDQCQQFDGGTDCEQSGLEAILDVYHILLGRDKDNQNAYVKSAVSELHACCKSLKRDAKRRASQGLESKDASRVAKKLEFLLSWSRHHESILFALSIEVLGFYKSKLTFMQRHSAGKRNFERLGRRKKFQGTLIEELN